MKVDGPKKTLVYVNTELALKNSERKNGNEAIRVDSFGTRNYYVSDLNFRQFCFADSRMYPVVVSTCWHGGQETPREDSTMGEYI